MNNEKLLAYHMATIAKPCASAYWAMLLEACESVTDFITTFGSNRLKMQHGGSFPFKKRLAKEIQAVIEGSLTEAFPALETCDNSQWADEEDPNEESMSIAIALRRHPLVTAVTIKNSWYSKPQSQYKVVCTCWDDSTPYVFFLSEKKDR